VKFRNRRVVITLIRILSVAGVAASLFFVRKLFEKSLLYSKIAYTNPHPEPIYQEIAPLVAGSLDEVLLLGAGFFMIFILTLFVTEQRT
jgi:hypothetical protein